MDRSQKRIYGVILAGIVLLAAAFFFWRADVFGKFVPQEPYVAQDKDSNDVTPESAQVEVTSEGSNQKGKDGSGKTPCATEVPTCEGKKGSEKNPFVVLEIVPSHEQQQLCYFAGDEESGLPFDPVEFSRKVLPAGNKNYTTGMSVTDLGIPSAFGTQWLTNTSYDIYEIGKPNKKKSVKLAEVGKYYTIEYTEKDIRRLAKENEKDPDQAVSEFQSVFNNDNGKISDLANKFPYLFKKDTTKEAVDIDPAALKDERNWKKTHATKGYLVVAGKENGEFLFDGYNIAKWDPNKFYWVYSPTKPSGGKDIFNDRGLDRWEIGKVNDNVSDYKGDYVSLSDLDGISANGIFEPQQIFSFSYYGLKFNDVLKRSLFTFSTEKEYKNFHLKVICMTPDELNRITKKDNNETVDMIERADMFFVQSGYSCDKNGLKEILGTPELYKIYNKWVKGKDAYSYDKKRDEASFFDTDLEWSSVMKIMKRMSENPNLPLMFNKAVGTMLNVGAEQKGEEDVCMYVTSSNSRMHKQGSLNNIAKLFLISTQFNLLARKADGYTSTFIEDIYPSIQQITLNDKNAHTAEQTGFYKRKESVGCTVDNGSHNKVEYQNRANYLWNPCTFYPEMVPWSVNPLTKDSERTKLLMSYGFFGSYLTDLDANPFTNNLAQQVSGATVNDEDKNVTIIGAARADYNESTLLHPSRESDTIGSNYLSIVAHTILNSQPNTAADMSVQVLKQKRQYVKLSDTSILLDYTSDTKYKDDRSYVKISVNANGNNMPGVISKVVLKKDDKEIPLTLYSSADFSAANECKKIICKDSNRTTSGYEVDGSLTAYVPYFLKDWADGYTTLQITTVGRIQKISRDGTITNKAGDDRKTDITIGERTLFNLS